MESNFISLVDFAQEIERVERVKNDYLASTNRMVMLEDGQQIHIDEVEGGFSITPQAHQQISARLGIPKKYYDDIERIPGLRAKNVNALFKHVPEKRLVRTLDGNARAFLSDRYKPVDNYFVLNAVLPVFKEHQDLQVKVQALSPKRMYLQVVFPRVQGEVVEGDVVQAGVTVSNSEVGLGALNVETFLWRLVCANGMIGSSLIRKYHSGRKIGGDVEDYNIFADDTIKAELDAYRLRIRDIMKHALSEVAFQKRLNMLKASVEDKIQKPQSVVENVTSRFTLSQGEGENLLANLVDGGQMNRYGLANGITRLAHSIESIDRQYEVEKMGSDIITLNESEWKVLSEEKVS